MNLSSKTSNINKKSKWQSNKCKKIKNKRNYCQNLKAYKVIWTSQADKIPKLIILIWN